MAKTKASDEVVTKIIALENLHRGLEGKTMDPMEMLLWKLALQSIPPAVLGPLMDDWEALMARVRSEISRQKEGTPGALGRRAPGQVKVSLGHAVPGHASARLRALLWVILAAAAVLVLALLWVATKAAGGT